MLLYRQKETAEAKNKGGNQVDKRIYIRVPEQLLKEFDRACKANYTTKSEVLRRAMLEYVRETKNEYVSVTDGEDYIAVTVAPNAE